MNIRDAIKNLPSPQDELLQCKVFVSMLVRQAGGLVRINVEDIANLDINARLHVREDPEGYYELRLEEPK